MRATEGNHPSFYALDRVRLGLTPEPALSAHLSACASCAALVEARAEAKPVPGAPLPGWLAGHRWAPAGPGPARGRWGRWRLGWLAVPTVALGALLLLVRPGRDLDAGAPFERSAGGVREKGSVQPSIRLFVRRQGRVFLWDGEAAIRPGDHLQLEVRGGGHRHLSVAVHPPDGLLPQVVYKGQLSRRRALLPRSFRVDEQGEREVLSVILGPRPIADVAHRREGGDSALPGLWRQILILEKPPLPQPPPDRSNR